MIGGVLVSCGHGIGWLGHMITCCILLWSGGLVGIVDVFDNGLWQALIGMG